MQDNIGITNITELPVTNSVGIVNPSMQESDINSNRQIPKIQNNDIKNSVVMDNNISQTSYNELVGQIQQADKLGVTQLPSRDIPNNTENIVMDDKTKANYIPEQEIMEDYINNLQTPEAVIQEADADNKNIDRLETLYSNIQMPLLVAILYFLFNLPIIRKYMYKYIPNIFNKDGNPNFVGYVVNGVLFGLLYYIMNNSIEHLTKF